MEGNVNYAGIMRRFVAGIIDAVIILISVGLINMAMGYILAGDFFSIEELGWAPTINSILVGWLYCAFLESSQKQATLGGIILGYKVCDENMNRISFVKATVRHIGIYVSTFTLLIGYIMIAFTKKKQALHDIIAKTVVITK